MSSSISAATVHHIAQLANIPITTQEEEKLSQAFSDTIEVIAHMSELDTTAVEPTHQVTGLENIFREDTINTQTMFTQEQALANAAKKHDGYFVVNQIIDQD